MPIIQFDIVTNPIGSVNAIYEGTKSEDNFMILRMRLALILFKKFNQGGT
jgi:hypothetical protein